MKFFQNMGLGYRSYYDAIKFVFQHRMYWYFLIPAVLMLGIYSIGAWLKKGWDTPDVENMNDIVWFMLELLWEITIAIILMKFAKYLVVILLSPLFSHLSQKVENIITGNSYPFSLTQTIHDVRRGLRIALRNIMWEYFFFLIIFLVAKIGFPEAKSNPVFYLTFVIGFFYYGFSFIDYINERRRLDIDQSIHFVRNHRGLAIAIGSVYSVLILVPVDIGLIIDYSNFDNAPWTTIGISVLNAFLWICASVAPILAIIAATLAMHRLVDLGSNEWSIKASENDNMNPDEYLHENLKESEIQDNLSEEDENSEEKNN